MSKFVSDVIRIGGYAQQTLSLSTTAAQTGQLREGIYDLWCDEDCYIKCAADSSDVTTSNGYLLRANNTIPIAIERNERLGGIVASGTATLSYHRVG